MAKFKYRKKIVVKKRKAEFPKPTMTREGVYACLDKGDLFGAIEIVKALKLDKRDFGIVRFVNLYLDYGCADAAVYYIKKYNLDVRQINFVNYIKRHGLEKLKPLLSETITINQYDKVVYKFPDPDLHNRIKHYLKHGLHSYAAELVIENNIDPNLFKEHILDDYYKYNEQKRAKIFMDLVKVDFTKENRSN